MSNNSIAIRVEHLSKEYRLGVLSHKTLYRDIQSFGSRLLGKEDPNSLIGAQKQGGNEKFLALDDVSFEVMQGDVLGVIGKNGAGKSTLLKILSKVTTPTKGEIKIKGRIASLLEVGTGFHPELTGRENIYLNGAILGMTKREIASKFDEIVSFAEIERFIDTPVKRYSSGMYVRLAFSVAAHLEPEILIVDEVLAVGDISFQKKCLGKMDNVSKKDGRTVLFVSHNMAFIRSLCNKAILLEKGKLIQEGKSIDLVNSYNLSFKEHKKFSDNFEIGNSQNRRGSGEARFSAITFYNHLGEETNNFEAGDDIIIRMSVKIFKRLKNLNFCFFIRSPLTEEVITSSQLLPVLKQPTEVGDCLTFEITLKQQNLRTGDFPLFLWLGDNSNAYYDVVDKIYSLNIISQKDELELGYNPEAPNGYFNVKHELHLL